MLHSAKGPIAWLLAFALWGCGAQRPGDPKPAGTRSASAAESNPAADSSLPPEPPAESPPVAPPPGAEAPESDAGADDTPACAELPPQVCECPSRTGADAGIPDAEAGPRIIAAQLLTPLLSGENRTVRLTVHAMAARDQGAIKIRLQNKNVMAMPGIELVQVRLEVVESAACEPDDAGCAVFADPQTEGRYQSPIAAEPWHRIPATFDLPELQAFAWATIQIELVGAGGASSKVLTAWYAKDLAACEASSWARAVQDRGMKAAIREIDASRAPMQPPLAAMRLEGHDITGGLQLVPGAARVSRSGDVFEADPELFVCQKPVVLPADTPMAVEITVLLPVVEPGAYSLRVAGQEAAFEILEP